jgi:hypothetical protein
MMPLILQYQWFRVYQKLRIGWGGSDEKGAAGNGAEEFPQA